MLLRRGFATGIPDFIQIKDPLWWLFSLARSKGRYTDGLEAIYLFPRQSCRVDCWLLMARRSDFSSLLKVLRHQLLVQLQYCGKPVLTAQLDYRVLFILRNVALSCYWWKADEFLRIENNNMTSAALAQWIFLFGLWVRRLATGMYAYLVYRTTRRRGHASPLFFFAET